jgi:hypothetical protein
MVGIDENNNINTKASAASAVISIAAPVKLSVPLVLRRDRATGRAVMWLPSHPVKERADAVEALRRSRQLDYRDSIITSVTPTMLPQLGYRGIAAWRRQWAPELGRLDNLVKAHMKRVFADARWDVAIDWDVLTARLRHCAYLASSGRVKCAAAAATPPVIVSCHAHHHKGPLSSIHHCSDQVAQASGGFFPAVDYGWRSSMTDADDDSDDDDDCRSSYASAAADENDA